MGNSRSIDEPIIIGDGSPLHVTWEDNDMNWDETSLTKPSTRAVTGVTINGKDQGYKKGTKLDLWVMYAVAGRSHDLYAHTGPNGKGLVIVPANDPDAPGFSFSKKKKKCHSVSRATGADVNAEITHAERRAGKTRIKKWNRHSIRADNEVVVTLER